MAPRDVNQNVAENVVRDSLGLSSDDLGMDRDDIFADLDLEGDDLPGDDNDDTLQLDQPDADDVLETDQNELQSRQQQQQPRPKPDDLRVSHTDEFKLDGKPNYDKKGNILGKDGKIIATAGREARMFTSLHQARERISTVQREANTQVTAMRTNLEKAVQIGTTLAQRLTVIQEVGQAHTRLGLNDTELQQALELAAAFKKSPTEAIKTILTRASASGIDLTTLGLQPGGFDPKSLVDLIRSEMGTLTKPILERQQQETAQQQVERERNEAVQASSQELSTFLDTNPDAKPFLPAFQKIYEQPQFAKMSLGEVWARIQLNLLRRQNENPGDQRRRSPNSQQRQQRRMPNGRGSPPDQGRDRQQPDNGLAPVETSYEDIVRQVLSTPGN